MNRHVIAQTDETERLYRLFIERAALINVQDYEREVLEFQIVSLARRVALRVAWHAGREAYMYLIKVAAWQCDGCRLDDLIADGAACKKCGKTQNSTALAND